MEILIATLCLILLDAGALVWGADSREDVYSEE